MEIQKIKFLEGNERTVHRLFFNEEIDEILHNF